MIVNTKSNRQDLVESTVSVKPCTQNGGIHGPLITDSISGEVLCGLCGLVLLDRMEDLSSEQRSFTMEQFTQRSRTGIASTLTVHDKGLATIIDPKNKDAFGNSISADMKSIFNRLRTWDSRSKSSTSERSMKSAFTILDSLKSKLDLPYAITERTSYHYRKAIAKKMTSGRSIVGVISASLYAACKEANFPRTLQDVAVAANITVKELSRDYRILVNRLGLQVGSYDSSDFVTRISSKVGMNEKTSRMALEFLSNAQQKGITDGKNPVSLAAGALFLASLISEEKKTQKDIAIASGISSVTIRNIAKVIRKNLAIGEK
ncbi:MAG: transcription initiation factor IIB [Nitrosotalea sp.]